MTPAIPMPLAEHEVARSLAIAKDMAIAGIPIFTAAPNPAHPAGYDLPPNWQHTTPDPRAVNQWRPGWALCAVGGLVCDFLDTDPRNGGSESRERLAQAGRWPRSYGRQATPSGGTHDLIAPLGVGKGTPARGVDLQGGRADGSGRGFVFLAPTVRVSKVDRTPRPYRWLAEPDLFVLATAGGSDTSGAHIAALAPVRVPKVRACLDERPRDIFCEWSPAQADAEIARQLTSVTEAAGGDWSGFRELLCCRAAYTLGGFVGAEYLSEVDAQARLVKAIEDAGEVPDGDDLLWIEQGLEDGAQEPLWVSRHDYRVDGAPLADRLVTPAVSAEGFASMLIDAADLDQMADPEPLIERWLYKDTTARLVGQPGSYKSFVALDMACCVALGQDWHGHSVSQSVVLYVVGEGLADYKRRVKAWCAANGVTTEALRGQLMLTRGAVQIGSTDWAGLASWAAESDAGFVIIDTQAKATSGFDENSNTDQGTIFAYLDRLRQTTGGTLLLLHHTGHANGDAGERGRGASAWRAAVDTEMLLTKTGERSAALVCDRQKTAESGHLLGVSMVRSAESLSVEISIANVPRSARSAWLADQVRSGARFTSANQIFAAVRTAGHKIGNADKSAIFDEYFKILSKHEETITPTPVIEDHPEKGPFS